jgi:hypothetical protein
MIGWHWIIIWKGLDESYHLISVLFWYLHGGTEKKTMNLSVVSVLGLYLNQVPPKYESRALLLHSASSLLYCRFQKFKIWWWNVNAFSSVFTYRLTLLLACVRASIFFSLWWVCFSPVNIISISKKLWFLIWLQFLMSLFQTILCRRCAMQMFAYGDFTVGFI